MIHEVPSEVLYTKGQPEPMAYDWVQGIGTASKQEGQKIKLTKNVKWARDNEVPERPEHLNTQPPSQVSNRFSINQAHVIDDSHFE